MKIDNILNESREWRRVEVNIDAQGEVLAEPGRFFLSRVININPDGMCFTVPEDLKSGQEVRLTMDLPALGRMEARLRIVWSAFFDLTKSHRAGGKFEAMAKGEKEKFQRFYHLKVMSSLGG